LKNSGLSIEYNEKRDRNKYSLLRRLKCFQNNGKTEIHERHVCGSFGSCCSSPVENQLILRKRQTKRWPSNIGPSERRDLKVTTVADGGDECSDPAVLQRAFDLGINFYDYGRLLYAWKELKRWWERSFRGKRDGSLYSDQGS